MTGAGVFVTVLRSPPTEHDRRSTPWTQVATLAAHRARRAQHALNTGTCVETQPGVSPRRRSQVRADVDAQSRRRRGMRAACTVANWSGRERHALLAVHILRCVRWCEHTERGRDSASTLAERRIQVLGVKCADVQPRRRRGMHAACTVADWCGCGEHAPATVHVLRRV